MRKNHLKIKKTLVGTLLLLVTTFLWYRLGESHLNSWDEARYAIHAIEAANHGNWLFPHLFGSPDTTMYDKPPLGVWLIASSIKLFGINEFAVRFWSVVAATGTVMVVFLFGSSISSVATGALGSLVLLTTHGYLGFHATRSGDFDVIFTFFTTLATCFFYSGYSDSKKNHYFFWYFILMACAFMLKSILVVPFILMAFTFSFCQNSARKCFLNKWSAWGLLAGLALIGIWFTLCLFYVDGFAQGVFSRFTGRVTDSIDSHGGPWYFYFPVLLRQFGKPWAFFLAFSIIYSTRRLWRREAIMLFVTLWVFVPLVLLCIAQTKLSWYTIPIMPGIALFLALNITNAYYYNSNQYLKAAILIIFSAALIKSASSAGELVMKTNEFEQIHAVQTLAPKLSNVSDVYIDFSTLPRHLRYSLPFYVYAHTNGRVYRLDDDNRMLITGEDVVLILDGETTMQLPMNKELEELANVEGVQLLKLK